MGKEDIQKRRNETLRLLKEIRSGSDINKVKLSAANTEQHEIAKARIAYRLLKEGKHFITEGEFAIGGGRCDVLDLDTGEVWEVLASETEEEAEAKVKKYPVPREKIHLIKLVPKK